MRSLANGEESPASVIHSAPTKSIPSNPGLARTEICASSALGGTLSIDVAPVASSLPVMHVNFSNEALLRGCPLKVLLSNFGAVFSDSKGSAETHSLSALTTGLRWFVSHNWSTPRLHKFAVLALTFNFYPAVAATAAALIAVLVLTAFGTLPLIEESASNDYAGRIGFCGQLVAPAVFLGVLFTWQEIASAIGLLSSKVFLDKICINQADDDLKREGIMSLAAFLGKTDGMLVVYSHIYLQRLWTVFELASLVILYPEKELKVVPVFFARFIVIGILAVMLFLLFFQLGRSSIMGFSLGGVMIAVPVALNTLAALFFSVVALYWAKGREEMRNALRSFRMADAACFEERDRGLVQKSVETFMKRRRVVAAAASREEALGTFERMIQEDVAKRLMSEIGFQGIPYIYIVAMWIPRFGRVVDLVGAYVHDAGEPEFVAFQAFHQLCINFFILPVVMAIPSLIMQTCTSLAGWRSRAIVLGASSSSLAMASFAVATLLNMLNSLVVERSPWGVPSMLALHLTFAALTWSIYSWLPRRSHR